MNATTYSTIKNEMQTWPTADLIEAVKMTVRDFNAICKGELASRGMDNQGRWVGHERARALWASLYWDNASGRWIAIPESE